jgi:hypothetical protein
VDHELTGRQRRLFLAIVVDGVPLDALCAELLTNRNAVHKTRSSRKEPQGRGMSSPFDVDAFLRPEPGDVGRGAAMEALHAAARRNPGVIAHVRACGPAGPGHDGRLTPVGSVTVPGGAGSEGIAAF